MTAQASVTRRLLLCGAVSGPLFIAVLVLDGLTMPGFSFQRHLISLLSIGDHGFVQVMNFGACGLLCMLCAVGVWRAIHGGPGGTFGPILLAAHGLFLVLVAVLVTDPSNGFPPGVPMPAHPTVHGAIHALGALWVFLTGAASLAILSRHFIARRETGWTLYCLVSTVASLGLFFPSFATNAPLLVDAAVVVGWMGISVVAWKLVVELRSASQTEAVRDPAKS